MPEKYRPGKRVRNDFKARVILAVWPKLYWGDSRGFQIVPLVNTGFFAKAQQKESFSAVKPGRRAAFRRFADCHRDFVAPPTKTGEQHFSCRRRRPGNSEEFQDRAEDY